MPQVFVINMMTHEELSIIPVPARFDTRFTFIECKFIITSFKPSRRSEYYFDSLHYAIESIPCGVGNSEVINIEKYFGSLSFPISNSFPSFLYQELDRCLRSEF